MAQKARTQKHHRNRGFSKFFLENRCASRNGHFWTKKPKTRNSSFFFLPFSSFSTTKTTTICRNPYFYSVLANLQKENFQILNLKHRNLEKKKKHFFAPFFEKKKAIFRQLANNWTQKTHTHNKMITEQKRSPETPIFIVRK